MKNIKSVFCSFLLVIILTVPLFYSVGIPENDGLYLKKYRVGCGCCDGTTSKATGRGACSHHGGVKYWVYYDDVTKEYTNQSTGRCDD